jgi:hypothetical protein
VSKTAAVNKVDTDRQFSDNVRLGRQPIVYVSSKRIKDGPQGFLIDTGANISIISKSALNDEEISKMQLPVKGCAGQSVSIEGHTCIPLQFSEGVQVPGYHFWVTPWKFDKFVGRIGTDILSDLNAVFDCTKQHLTLNTNPNGVEPNMQKAPIQYIYHIEGLGKVYHLTRSTNRHRQQKAVQVIVRVDTIIPAMSQKIFRASLRYKPLLNTPFFIPSTVLGE